MHSSIDRSSGYLWDMNGDLDHWGPGINASLKEREKQIVLGNPKHIQTA